MGIAYSKRPIGVGEYNGATPAALLAGFHTIATAASWPSVPITNGYEYTITSPQDFVTAAKVRVWYGNVSDNHIHVQMTSLDGTRLGALHAVQCADDLFWTHAGCCQFFTARKGNGGYQYSVCGGIPFVPIENAAAIGERQTSLALGTFTPPEGGLEVWWSTRWFRDRYCSEATLGGYCGCWAGNLRVNDDTRDEPEGPGFPNPGVVTLVPVRPTAPYQGKPTRMRKVGTLAPLYLDPLLFWGPHGPCAKHYLRGQLYDCVEVSVEADLEHEMTWDGYTWTNYMRSTIADNYGPRVTWYCSLYLLKSIPPAVGGLANYAY